jgi:hypothetical protein
MPDILIRNVPAEDLAQVDRNAKAQGLSRGEYLRRRIAGEPGHADTTTMTDADWADFAERTQDLLDEDIMRRAWSCDAE